MINHLQSLEFRLVTEQSDLFSIADDWRRLLAESSAPETMMQPNWLLGWWRQYGSGVELAVGLLFDGERLVGLAPLCIRKFSYCPGLRFRRLQFMGVDAEDVDGICSMYMGFIAARGYEDRVGETFIDHAVAGNFGYAHEIMLGPMRSPSPERARMQSRLESYGLRCEEKRQTTSFLVTLPASWSEYLRSLPGENRSYINTSVANFERWANEHGGLTLEQASGPEAIEAAFGTLIGLQLERLSPRFLAFQRAYIANKHPSAQIEILTLRVGSAATASVYTIRNGHSVVAYQYGWASVPNIDMGVALNALLIQRSIERGDTTLDFLTGGYGFEPEFATDKRPMCTLRAVWPSWREAIRSSLVDARDAGRLVARAGRSVVRKSPIGFLGFRRNAEARRVR